MALHLLPKKSWHVWKDSNVERVRQDEARHAAEVEEKTSKEVAADQGAMFEALRARAAVPAAFSIPTGHAAAPTPRHRGPQHSAEGGSGGGDRSSKSKLSAASGVPLGEGALDARGNRPWYAQNPTVGSSRSNDGGIGGAALVGGHRDDSRKKAAHDPLSLVRRTLAGAGAVSVQPGRAQGGSAGAAPGRQELRPASVRGATPPSPGDATPLSRLLGTPSSATPSFAIPDTSHGHAQDGTMERMRGTRAGAGSSETGLPRHKHRNRDRDSETRRHHRHRRRPRSRSRSRSRGRGSPDHGARSGSGQSISGSQVKGPGLSASVLEQLRHERLVRECAEESRVHAIVMGSGGGSTAANSWNGSKRGESYPLHQKGGGQRR